MTPRRYAIGIDTGGTFTDCVVVDSFGGITIGKAPSTPGDPTAGVVDSLLDSATVLQIELKELLENTTRFVYSTTIATNAFLTMRGAKTGLITTKNFEDTLSIGRIHQKVAGLSEAETTYAVRLDKADPIVPRKLIKGVTERIDSLGEVVVPLNEAETEQAIESLMQDGVEAMAICLLWSFLNPKHEQRIIEIVKWKYPGCPVVDSSEVAPQLGEYERMATVVLEAFLRPAMAQHLGRLNQRLRDLGLGCDVMVTHCGGGALPYEEIANRAVMSIASGPVAGVSAGKFWGQALGYPDIICTDVGGTSFDVSLITKGEATSTRMLLGKYHTAVPMVRVDSIGTGGGSIAWMEPITNLLRVGPQSAGAVPGPACYDRGGEEPTVTDAGVVLGYIDPDCFLGGRMRLNKEKAFSTIDLNIARPMGLDVYQAAAAVYRVSNSQLADLLHRITVEKGYDPSKFILLAYGGAGPQYAGLYADEAGIKLIVIPQVAAAFSAFGCAVADLAVSRQYSLPLPIPGDTARLNDIYGELEAKVRDTLRRAVRSAADVHVERFVEMRYNRQIHEVRVPVPIGQITRKAMDTIVTRFEQTYEELYGKGTVFSQAGMEMITYGVQGLLPGPKLELTQSPLTKADASSAVKSSRPAYFIKYGQFVDTCVYDGAKLQNGHQIVGPGIVELPTTTIVIQPGQTARLDAYRNVIIEVAQQIEVGAAQL